MATYKKFNVSKPRKEVLKNGEEKTFWDNVGMVTIFTKDDGTESGLLDLHSFNEDIRLNLFPFKPREDASKLKHNYQPANNYSQPSPVNDYSQPEHEESEEIHIENIPF